MLLLRSQRPVGLKSLLDRVLSGFSHAAATVPLTKFVTDNYWRDNRVELSECVIGKRRESHFGNLELGTKSFTRKLYLICFNGQPSIAIVVSKLFILVLSRRIGETMRVSC